MLYTIIIRAHDGSIIATYENVSDYAWSQNGGFLRFTDRYNKMHFVQGAIISIDQEDPSKSGNDILPGDALL